MNYNKFQILDILFDLSHSTMATNTNVSVQQMPAQPENQVVPANVLVNVRYYFLGALLLS
jgi:hypothetical protein